MVNLKKYNNYLYLLLACFWPFINFANNNRSKISDWSDLIWCGLTFSILIFLTALILSKIIKNKSETIWLLLSYLVIMFFSYSAFFEILFESGYLDINLFGIRIKFVVWWILGVLLGGVFIWKLSDLKSLHDFSKIFLIIISVVPLLQFLFYEISSHKPLNNQSYNGEFAVSFKQKPNIYFFLLDAYARADTLEDILKFSNKDFLDGLREQGFIVKDKAFSNYHFTSASVSSTMQMQYHTFASDGLIYHENQFKEPLLGKNAVVDILKNNGYKYIYIPAHWQQMQCSKSEDYCIRSNRGKELLRSIIAATPIRYLQNKIPNIYVATEDILKAKDLEDNAPKFVFAHFAQVHDAVYDKSCNIVNSGVPIFSDLENGANYKNSIICLNYKLLDVVRKIRATDDKAIIIIQADHGPLYVGNRDNPSVDFWLKNHEDWRVLTKEDLRNSFGIISAVFIPKIINDPYYYKILDNGFSSVNLFRFIFAWLTKTPTNLLVDKNFLLYYDPEKLAYHSIDVTQFKDTTVDNFSDYKRLK